MSTITSCPRTQVAPTSPEGTGPGQGDQRIVLRGVGWQIYETLTEAIGEGQHVRLTYDGKDLEIMDDGDIHEQYKELLGKIVAAVTLGLNIERSGHAARRRGSTEIERGLEADLSYYFDPREVRAAREAMAPHVDETGRLSPSRSGDRDRPLRPK